MADDVAVPVADGVPDRAPPPSQVRQWGRLRDLSSLRWVETALVMRQFEKMPWLAVAMLVGILVWFGLPSPGEWLVFLGLCGLSAALVLLFLDDETYPFVRGAVVSLVLMMAAGLMIAWGRSTLVGTPGIGRPVVAEMTVRVIEREEASRGRSARLLLATRDATGETIRARVTLSEEFDLPELGPGALVRARLRLIPPSRAVAPGLYDYAQAAWFDGISATGSVMSEFEVFEGARSRETSDVQADLHKLVLDRIDDAGAAGIAATLVTGERWAIPDADAEAMRNSGMAHLLSISGLHVGAVIAIVWFVSLRLLALWPALALRVPLPFVAAGAGAFAGIGYTLLTGAALPTIRACIAAILVLAAMALGRQALSMRLVAIAAIVVMLFWPEAVVGASFQLSFAAVIAIVALHNSAPVVRFRAATHQFSLPVRAVRHGWMLFLTGLVIEVSLLPLVMMHFHKAGLYGAAANLFAIPLTTMVVMPLIGICLVLEPLGLSGPLWSLCGTATGWLLDIAHTTSSAPGAVKISPLVPLWLVFTIAASGTWLALWTGRSRLLGVPGMVLGILALLSLSPPDLIVSGSGRQLALNSGGNTYWLRGPESFESERIGELVGLATDDSGGSFASSLTLIDFHGARCNDAFCSIEAGNGQDVQILIGRGRVHADPDELRQACAQSDIVIAENALPKLCEPKWLMLDGRMLSRRGGAAIDIDARVVSYVRPAGDAHGW